MYTQRVRQLSQKVAVVALGMTLVIGAAGVATAGASSQLHAAKSQHAAQERRRHHHADINGVVSAVSPSSITVQRTSITSSTLLLASTTTVFEGKTPVAQSALADGQRVNISRAAAAPNVAAKIVIQVATLVGTVTSVNGNTITISGGEGFTRTIDVSSATTYTEAGTSVSLASVLVGSKITARGLVSSDQTTLDALSITIAAPWDVRGDVSAVSTTWVTVIGSGGAVTTMTINPATTFFEGTVPVTPAALVVGEHVVVTRINSALTTAVKITIETATLTGTVSSVSGNTIMITGGGGFTHTVDVGSSTTYTEGGNAATLSAVVVGLKISAKGIVASDHTVLDAQSVAITAPKDVRGVVTAVTGTSVTVQNSKTSTTVVTVNPSTSFFAGTNPVTSAALAVGEHVDVALSPSAPMTAVKVNIQVVSLTGTVSSVSGEAITITGGSGFTRTIDVSAVTTYTEGGAAATLADVIVDAKITAVGLVSTNQTSLDALSVAITAPSELKGVVTATTGTSITVLGSGSVSTTLAINSATVFLVGTSLVTPAALVVGEHVDVTRLAASLGTAAKITIQMVTVAGTVTSVSGNTIVVNAGKGFARTIVVSTATTYSEGGSPSTLSAVIVGSKITALGLVDSNQTTLDALILTIAVPKAV